MNTWKTVFIVFWICLVLSVISGMAYLSPIEVEDKCKPQKNASSMQSDGVGWVERSETQQSNLCPTPIGDPKLVPNLDWGSKLDKAELAQKTQKLQMPFIANNGQVDEQVRFYANTFGGTVFVTKDGDIVYSLPFGRDDPAGASQKSGRGLKHGGGGAEGQGSSETFRDALHASLYYMGQWNRVVGAQGADGWHGQALLVRDDGPQEQAPLVRVESAFVANVYSPLLHADIANCPPDRFLTNALLAAYFPGLQESADKIVGTRGTVSLQGTYLPGLQEDTDKMVGTRCPHPPRLAHLSVLQEDTDKQSLSMPPNSNSNVLPANYHAKSPLLGGDLGVGEPLPETYPQLRLGIQSLSSTLIGDPQSPTRGVALKEQLVGGKISEIKGGAQSVTTVSYFKGNDPSKWKSNISTYEVVDMGEVYDGIGLRLKAYGNNVEKLFCVKPGANPEQIKIRLDGIQPPESPFIKGEYRRPGGGVSTKSPLEKGARGLWVNEEGKLVAETELGPVKFTKPVAYQEIDGKRIYVDVAYQIENCKMQNAEQGITHPLPLSRGEYISSLLGGDSGVGKSNTDTDNGHGSREYCFTVASYDKTKDLIIDPLLASTFLGGASDDIGRSLTRDANGNIYVVGETDSFDFPITPGVYRTTSSAKTDMFVSKLSGDLKTLLVSTVIGGSDEDVATGVAVSPSSGDIYITGFTRSTDFPVQSAYDATFNGGKTDIVIAKLGGDLARLLASTYLGGAGEDCGDNCLIDDYASSIKIAPDQSVAVAGYTFSTSFPITKNAYDQIHSGYADGIVSVLSSDLSKLIASTYLGGYGGDSIGGYYADDFGDALAIDSEGNLYVGGATGSLNFPVTQGAYDTEPMAQGDDDAFVTKFDSKLTRIIASTFLGGDKRDAVCALSLGSGGEVYVAGATESKNFPTTEGAYDREYNDEEGKQYGDLFVSKFTMDLGTLIASTFLGGSYTDRCAAMAIDSTGNVFVAGRTSSDQAKMSDFPTTPGAFDRDFDQSIGNDGILSELSGDLSKLLASTFLGGSSGKEDRPYSMIIDSGGNAYVTGKTWSPDFPTTPGAYDGCHNGYSDVFISGLDGSLSSSFPTVTTLDATNVTKNSAILNGTVNASGLSTTAWFIYGAASGLYTGTSTTQIVTGLNNTEVNFFVDDLLPDTTYFYRLKAQNSAGAADGSEKEFTTAATSSKISIKIKISRTEITFGEFVEITGKAALNQMTQVTLSFINDKDEIDTKTVTSNANGRFSLKYFPIAGGSWGVKAALEDENNYVIAESNSRSFTVNQAQAEYTIEAFPNTIRRDEEVDITGIITLNPDNEVTRDRFLKEKLKLVRIMPENSGYEDIIETQPFLSGGQLRYKFQCVRLPIAGKWTVLAGLDEDESFKRGFSDKISIEVGNALTDRAGYAILVEGRVEDNSGIASHNLTTNDIYKKLLRCGFTGENIYYFNFDDSQNGVDEKPTRDKISNAIKSWAKDKMNKYPYAPLYIIFVGHGKNQEFPIFPDTITASDMEDNLHTLESGLNTEASEEAIVVVFGANHSGSFIKALSKPDTNRIIIASSDVEEAAYKGPLPPDETIRQGDYFVSEFFTYAAMGLTIKKCYETAAAEIAEYTRNANGNGLKGENAGNGQYFDKSAQHPLLDDNGDGAGTYGELSSLDERDGMLASNRRIKIGVTSDSLELTKVTDVISLNATDTTPELFAKASNTNRVDKIWTEIAPPGHSLPYKEGETEQQVVDLPRFSYNDFDEEQQRYIWNDFSGEQINNFREAGEYEVFYFARDVDTGDITTLKDSNVYRNAQGNQKPMPFNLISPLDGETTPVALIFDWKDSADNDGDAVKYTLTISKSMSFDTIDYQLKDITASAAVVDKTAALGDDVTYYWRVTSIDARGGTTFMGGGGDTGKPFASDPPPPDITANLSEGLLGFISGYVYDVMMSSAKISGAKVTVDGITGNNFTTGQGLYIIGPLPSGSYTLRASASGYGQGIGSVRVDGINESFLDIGLTKTSNQATISGAVYIKLRRGTRRAGSAIVGVHTDLKLLKKGKTIAKTTTKRDGSYTIQLSPGDYYMRAIKTISSGADAGTYRGFYNNSGSFHLGTGENKTGCNITITK